MLSFAVGARLRALVLLTIAAALSLGMAVVPDAHASLTVREKRARLLDITNNQKGDPYRYGAAGPDAFDCSGLVYYAFRKALGWNVPRTAEEQRRASERIVHRRNLRRGDLVFEVDSSGHAYHVGIYAGNGYFWHAPHTGSYVKRQKFYPAHWRYGRIIGS